MKKIIYFIEGFSNVIDGVGEVVETPTLSKIEMPWSESNEGIAKTEAYNGKYEIIDDGEPEAAPSQLDIIEAQVTYTAMMTDTLLEV